MSAFVVDTNVPVVANGRSDQANEDCVIACIDALAAVRDDGIIVLDSIGLILDEYMDNLSLAGQPGAGDLFMKWVFENQAVVERCEQVQITARRDDPSSFNELPEDEELARFDRSDRKFVAVALASRNAPQVLNAVDSDWAASHAALERNGVRIRFLCPQHVCPAN
jgi:hypothetical protein